MERAADLQPDRARSAAARLLLRAPDRFHASREHDLLRAVLVRDLEHVASSGYVADLRTLLGREPYQRRHRPRALVARRLHRAATLADDVKCRYEIEHAGGDKRGELTERGACPGPDPPR